MYVYLGGISLQFPNMEQNDNFYAQMPIDFMDIIRKRSFDLDVVTIIFSLHL